MFQIKMSEVDWRREATTWTYLFKKKKKKEDWHESISLCNYIVSMHHLPEVV